MTDQMKDVCPSCGGLMAEVDDKSIESLKRDLTQMQMEAGRDAARGRYVNNRI
jgi:transcription initiation factor IIE alpha subunit